ncbi:UNVERIFIED_ORG: hypothetical protein J2806_003958 [Kosakonia oryzae]|uniref:Uncharacterized protein n=1 Tax=Kosakonia radicincitans TaxID=283686 RepID=A0AAX2EYH8_9ENTR|nr:hypothetical protein [Kosakonia oryzae]SFF26373.1 hypothetical protein SAMN03159468_04402 [Kosakonia radicincitans]SFR25254.1 hypothetical protein SAMN03159514_04592 [Kosakonia radicincitans]SFU06841.1 hypothetical protein SAMN03159428_03865 [Kosakonia radicincitans]SFY05548.1 hypothetical protein SAMN03159436_03588 [Kosakonia radicincitans]
MNPVTIITRSGVLSPQDVNFAEQLARTINGYFRQARECQKIAAYSG